MILFYSNYCTSSQMLLNQLDQYGVKKHFKVVNVEKILSKGLKLPESVTVVPSLMLMPQKNVLSGKQLFDYLLLPNKGLVFLLDKQALSQKSDTDKGTASNELDGPSAFGFKNNCSSDLFSFIEEDSHESDPHKQYNWSNLQDDGVILTNEMMSASTAEASSGGKSTPDLSKLQSDRAMDLQNYLNTSTLPPASTNA